MQKRKEKKIKWLLLPVLVIGIFLIYYLNDENHKLPKTIVKKAAEPPFVEEGQLSFISKEKGDTIRQVAIEIADNNADRAKGLMYRNTMPDTRAMLFIFEQESKRSFWMKNTLMSLDILYVNKNKEIVTIYKHTQPYSENSIPSFKEAMYVVETIAGFCDKYQIKEGDLIVFTKD